jgi:hypothetical protein
MEYTGQEKDIFFSKLVKNIDLDVKKLMNDVEIYITFELYRRKVLKELKK